MKITPEIQRLIWTALREDLGDRGDITTENFLPGKAIRTRIVAKASGVFCGGRVAEAVFRRLCPKIRVRLAAKEGTQVRPGQTLMEISGPRQILSAERTALNFLQRLSGIATLTRRYVSALRGTGVPVFDTRKTTPGWRTLEKYAVRCGGGRNHRLGLFDAAMVKDNHIRVLQGSAPSAECYGYQRPVLWDRTTPQGARDWERGGWADELRKKVEYFRKRYPKVSVEIEAQNLTEVRQVLGCRPDAVLLDNMSFAVLRRAVRLVRSSAGKILVEISGGVTLRGIRKLARLRPDRISVGRLTHSASSLDLSMEVQASDER